MTRIHTAICTADVDASLRFWRDGLGFEVQMDLAFDATLARLHELGIVHELHTSAWYVERRAAIDLADYACEPRT